MKGETFAYSPRKSACCSSRKTDFCWGLLVTKHMQVLRNSHHALLLNLWPTLSVLQSGLREHRWRLILSWLLHITVQRCWVHSRPQKELSQVLWGPCCQPSDGPPTLRTGIKSAGLNLSLHPFTLTERFSYNMPVVCVCVCSSRRPASQVCVLQLVLWIRPMTDTSYNPAISQHQGGTVPLPTRPRTTACCNIYCERIPFSPFVLLCNMNLGSV